MWPFGQACKANGSLCETQRDACRYIVSVNGYAGRDLLDTLGVRLVAGRNFLPDEYDGFGLAGGSNGAPADKRRGPQAIIITQVIADKLFPGGDAR